MKKLMLGNEAVARGAYEAGVRFVSSYPGTPSTEITESIVQYKDDIFAEWAPNEKVACEAAAGAAIAGARAMTCCKHVGLNVMADPVFSMSYIGANGGLVIAVADDPGMHSSQNEQDSRHYAKASKIPMLEPSDSGECKEFTKAAFELSEQYDTPVFLRLSTRVSHSQSLVELEERAALDLKPYEKNIPKNVMMPAMAVKKHVIVEERQKKLAELAERTPLNSIEDNGSEIGVITSGISYLYAKEALGDRVNYLKLGLAYPMPENMIRRFAKKCRTLYVIEELDPFIEEHVRALGIPCIGKMVSPGKEKFSYLYEYTAAMIRKAVFPEEAEEDDPRAELVQQLLEYKLYKYMSFELKDREIHASRSLFRAPDIPEEVQNYQAPVDLDHFLKGVDLARLKQVFDDVLRRSRDKRNEEAIQYGKINREPISLPDRLASIRSYTKAHKKFSFRRLLEDAETRENVIVTFLAILELMKNGEVVAVQEEKEDIVLYRPDAAPAPPPEDAENEA